MKTITRNDGAWSYLLEHSLMACMQYQHATTEDLQDHSKKTSFQFPYIKSLCICVRACVFQEDVGADTHSYIYLVPPPPRKASPLTKKHCNYLIYPLQSCKHCRKVKHTLLVPLQHTSLFALLFKGCRNCQQSLMNLCSAMAKIIYFSAYS